jgi:hypothetical protein
MFKNSIGIDLAALERVVQILLVKPTFRAKTQVCATGFGNKLYQGGMSC